MALFKFRKGGDESVATAPQPESVEALRKRARHRLIGAAVLVLVGIVGFPLVFDTQPRPIAVDIPIEIPDRNKTKPLPLPPVTSAQAPAVSGPINAPASAVTAAKPASAPVAAASPKSEPQPAVITESKSEAKVEPVKPAPPKAETPKPEPRAEAKAEPKPALAAPKRDDASRAQALLEGKAVDVTDRKAPAAAEGRFVVQVGAFADATKARETRLKVEHAGLKTYTQVAETKDGKRIRVRVGPFATRAEADRAAQKIKGLELPAAVLTL